jgi:phospholipid/cholesterol/gamma-HCH transport system substrate-binding protein
MLKYRGSNLIRRGFIGLTLIQLIILVGLQPEKLWSLATTVRYQALFAEAAGLAVNNAVRMAGMKIGSVSDISLRTGKVLVTFTVDGKVRLGSESTAHIRTGTLLGQRVLTVESAGSGKLRAADIIPISRTSSPYSLSEAVSDLTTNTSGTDTASINKSLDTLSDTLDRIAPRLGATFDGLTRLSRSLNGRNETLHKLLNNVGQVSGVLAARSQQLNTLILNANDLVAVLNGHREAIVDLLASISAVAAQLSGLVADNQKDLAPALEKLNSVAAMLEKNRDNIAKALPGLAKYELEQGEAVASGYYYQGYIANMLPGQVLQPFLDYLYGFRTFDTAPGRGPGFPSPTPRALFPWPYNGIPGGSR